MYEQLPILLHCFYVAALAAWRGSWLNHKHASPLKPEYVHCPLLLIGKGGSSASRNLRVASPSDGSLARP